MCMGTHRCTANIMCKRGVRCDILSKTSSNSPLCLVTLGRRGKPKVTSFMSSSLCDGANMLLSLKPVTIYRLLVIKQKVCHLWYLRGKFWRPWNYPNMDESPIWVPMEKKCWPMEKNFHAWKKISMYGKKISIYGKKFPCMEISDGGLHYIKALSHLKQACGFSP